MVNSNTNRNYKIDVLKVIFTLVVILGHSGGIANDLPDIFNYAHWSGGGGVAVEFFFILSGYFLMLSYKNHQCVDCVSDTIQYICKKIKGFAFPYLISFSMLFLLTWTFKNVLVKETFPRFFDVIIGLIKALYFSIPEITGIYMTGPLDRNYTYNEPTWYISAMIFVMIPLFYLLCRNYNFTAYILAPIVGMLVFGYRFNNPNAGFGDWYTFNGIVYNGVVRALGDMLLGIVCYSCAEQAKLLKLTRLTKGIFTAVEVMGWLGIIRFILFTHEKGNTTYFILVLIIAFLITLSVSNITYTDNLFNGKYLQKAGKYSLLLYLNHYTARNILHYCFASNCYWINLFLYYFLSAIAAFICYYIMKGLTNVWNRVRFLFIEEA